jgi:amino acid transporter
LLAAMINYCLLDIHEFFLILTHKRKEKHMKKNMGTIDRIIRIVLAIVVAILYMNGSITGVAAVILGILALVFIITSLIGFCPLYVPFKISTISKSK